MYKTILAALALILAVVCGSGDVTGQEPAKRSEETWTVTNMGTGSYREAGGGDAAFRFQFAGGSEE